MILLKSKDEKGRGNLTEAEKRIFVGDFRGGCMHK